MNRKLEEGEVISYETSAGKHVVISQSRYDDDFLDFECYGDCICEEEFKTTLLQKNLFMFVSHYDRKEAIKSAYSRLQNLCKSAHRVMCMENKILGNLISCKENDEDPLEKDKTVGFWEFECEGYCQVNQQLEDIENPAVLEYAQKFGCHDLHIINLIEISGYYGYEDARDTAEMIMVGENLEDYCYQKSRIQYPTYSKPKFWWKKKYRRTNACISVKDNVHCTTLEKGKVLENF